MLEYKFKGEKCACGQKLSGKKVELEGMKGPIPMGRCPKCSTAHPLVEIEHKPEPETERQAKERAEREAEEAREEARVEEEARAKEEAEAEAKAKAEAEAEA